MLGDAGLSDGAGLSAGDSGREFSAPRPPLLSYGELHFCKWAADELRCSHTPRVLQQGKYVVSSPGKIHFSTFLDGNR